MANQLIRIPISGNAIDVETTEIETVAGEIVVVTFEPSVTGKLTIFTSGDSVGVAYQEGPHEIDVPPGS